MVNLKFIFDIIDSKIDYYNKLDIINQQSKEEAISALDQVKVELKQFIKDANKITSTHHEY